MAVTRPASVLDASAIRSNFPALDAAWAFLDNAGGSAPCRQVIARVCAHMERLPVQLGASYRSSVEARAAVVAGRAAAAELVRAQPEEVVLGASTTMLVDQLARSLRAGWSEGDEVVVTNLDHEANVGPWRKLAESGIVVREWRFRPDSLDLCLEDLEPLLSKRTRLVAFTHCSNVVGTIVDVASVTARLRAAGVLSCVDGVAFAPHRHVDVAALGADFYFASLYKVYGPHLGLMYGRRELLLEMRSPNHFFVAPDAIPTKFEPGNVNYELAASLVGIVDYLNEVGGQHGYAEEARLAGAFELFAQHEEALARPLLSWLDRHPRVKLIGSPSADRASRVPTISFTVEGRRASEIPPELDRRNLATRFGHFYAYRLVHDLDLLERDGVVRISLVHYNTQAEVERVIEGLDAVL